MYNVVHLRFSLCTPYLPLTAWEMVHWYHLNPSRRWHRIKSLRTLRLPRHLGLPVNLSQRLEVLPAIDQHSPQDDRIGAHDLLVVVGVGSAVGAIVAVDGLAGVAVVGVRLQPAFSPPLVILRADLGMIWLRE
jgi:hypothetical protein